MADDLYRMAPGHIGYDALLADADYLIANWPHAAIGAKWLVKTNGIIVPYALRTRTPSGKNYGLGSPRTEWDFGAINREQVEWFIDTHTDGALDADVTIYSWRFNNMSATGFARNWVVMHCRLELPELTPDGLTNVNDAWNEQFAIKLLRGTFVEDEA